MDLNYTPAELKFRDALRAWLAANVPADWNGSQGFDYLRGWQRRVHAGGWAGVSWPREYGGRGATVVEQVISMEEMARASAPPLANVLGLSLIGPTIIAQGSEAQSQSHSLDAAAKDHDDRLTYFRAMEIALRELLIAKAILTADDVRSAVEAMDSRTPENGARKTV